jgi:hypothetical protein
VALTTGNVPSVLPGSGAEENALGLAVRENNIVSKEVLALLRLFTRIPNAVRLFRNGSFPDLRRRSYALHPRE